MIKILVAEDEIDLREYLQELLEDSIECQVDAAENGKIALEYSQKNQYDLLCSDFQMPMMTGGQLVKSIREESDLNKATPVIFLSAYNSKSKEATINMSNVYFLEKPVDETQLLKCVQLALSEQPAS